MERECRYVSQRQPDFVVTVLKALGPSPSRVTGIDIEITESMVAQNTGSNVQKLQRLREAGLQISVDDFGTGYSGLSQIAQLPLDGLKIDRAFVAGMNISAEHMAIVWLSPRVSLYSADASRRYFPAAAASSVSALRR
jgi:EAL domain-containing protein (putative c-di-GMP-specific phosphodiesterase class I)